MPTDIENSKTIRKTLFGNRADLFLAKIVQAISLLLINNFWGLNKTLYDVSIDKQVESIWTLEFLVVMKILKLNFGLH